VTAAEQGWQQRPEAGQADPRQGEEYWQQSSKAGWSLANTYELCRIGEEDCFQNKAQYLDPSSHTSVAASVEALNQCAVTAEAGFCVMFSQSRQMYYLLWHECYREAAFNQLGLQFGDTWSPSLCRVLQIMVGQEEWFEGKATLLPRDRYDSVERAVDALNAGEVKVDDGFCIVFSSSKQSYYLLWLMAKEDEALRRFEAM